MGIILGLVLHRLTASKEGINMLHKSNHVISYNNIFEQNKAWSKMIANNQLYSLIFAKELQPTVPLTTTMVGKKPGQAKELLTIPTKHYFRHHQKTKRKYL